LIEVVVIRVLGIQGIEGTVMITNVTVLATTEEVRSMREASEVVVALLSTSPALAA